MATPFESAQLILQLYEMRRESVLREARQWFVRELNPTSFEELVAIIGGNRNASFRMVIGYWDMAASLVTFGAIDARMFMAANGEIIATFAKVHPFLAQMREATRNPELLRHLETVVMAVPGVESRMEQLRREFLQMQATRQPDAEAR